MAEYFAYRYTGAPFELFGLAHLGTLVALAVLAALFLRRGRDADRGAQDRMRRAFAAFAIVHEFGWHAWNLYHGSWTWNSMLPLHLCTIMIWSTSITFLVGGRRFYPLIYYLGIAGAAQALITPDAGLYGFPHYRFFETLVAHGIVVTAGIWVVLVEGYRPTLRHAAGSFAVLNGYALVVFFINLAIGSNYLYVNGPPAVPTLIDALPAWPWYIPILEVLGILILGVLYAPFARRALSSATSPSSPEKAYAGTATTR